jgi:uncharacterized protein YegJ (DUF2314 family)
MIEEIGNIAFKDADILYARWKKWQRENTALLIKPGDFVKVRVDHVNCISEHLWVEILVCSKSQVKFWGKLANSPLQLPYSMGHAITLHRRDIEDHLEGKSNKKQSQ